MFSFFKKYNIEEEKIAVGVSGGADSLALVLLLHEYFSKQSKRVIALTVDHGLRRESGDEAQYVASVMKNMGIEHHILEWKGTKPKTAIEETAREARYGLLQDWCKQNEVNVLAIAHHAKDQAEMLASAIGQKVKGIISADKKEPKSCSCGEHAPMPGEMY